MAHKIITQPTVEPLVLSEIAARLNISDVSNDDDIEHNITAARREAESYTGRFLITQTVEWAFNVFPAVIEIGGPLQSVGSIKYLDAAGAEQTLASENYAVDDYGLVPRIVPAIGGVWPDTCVTVNAVKVRCVVGYGDAGSEVPEDIRLAMLLLLGHWLRFRADMEQGAGPSRIPRQFYDLLAKYRITLF